METRKHSGLGIASFITSLVSGFFLLIMFGVAGVMETTTPGGIDEESAEAMIVGLFIFAFLGLSLVALGLGIAGLAQNDRRKIFALLGTIFSGVSIIGTLLIMIIGLTMV
ncbi:MAG: hypothetical protein ACLFV4_12195 [Candidatus Hydrogenedentota bacterium]